MTQIGSFEAKTHFSDLLNRVAQGEEFIVTKRGKPVASLTPLEELKSAKNIMAVLDELRTFKARIAKNGNLLKKGETLKDLAREGLK